MGKHTQKVPRADVDRDIPHTTDSSYADDNTETKHGDQGDPLAKGNLDGSEVFRRPEEDDDCSKYWSA